jgi:hypothetical protein
LWCFSLFLLCLWCFCFHFYIVLWCFSLFLHCEKNTTTQCRNKGKTPQHNVGIKKNTTTQWRNENKNTTKQCKVEFSVTFFSRVAISS